MAGWCNSRVTPRILAANKANRITKKHLDSQSTLRSRGEGALRRREKEERNVNKLGGGG